LSRRVQFNVRVREQVAEDLRNEAASLSIGMGELVEVLAENYRAGTRSGRWLELSPPMDDALRALAAARQEEPDEVLQGLVAGVVREQLEALVLRLARTGEILAAPQPIETPKPKKARKPSRPRKAATPAPKSAESGQGDAVPKPAPATEPEGKQDWQGRDRRRRSRDKKLSEADRAALASLPDDLPRTGPALRTWRQKRGLSARELGELCGVTQVAVGLWEKKERLSPPILIKLGRGLARLR